MDSVEKSKLTQADFSQTMSYEAYMKYSIEALNQGKTTSDDPHFNEDWVLELTKLNMQRVHRLEKTTTLTTALKDAIEEVHRPMKWVVFAESWCGDVAQNLPVLHSMVQLNPKITLEILLRDKNTAAMDLYLTNGGRSIPKLVAIDAETNMELGTWGPRPQAAQVKMREAIEQGVSKDDRNTMIHTWYAKDKTQSLQEEFTTLIHHWSKGKFCSI